MRSIAKNLFSVSIFILFGGFLNNDNLAETKNFSIIKLFCLQSFKEEMLKAKLTYDEDIAEDTCDCYLKEFSEKTSHQKAINKCKLETQKRFDLKKI
tara:strand:+ start:232 stop:522 length:291 start_codon:yes stop_codon:yes gene_type:complete